MCDGHGGTDAQRRDVLKTLAGSAAGLWSVTAAPGVLRAAEQAPRSASSSPAVVAESFPLSSVKLLPGPFETARQLDARYLLSLEPDRMLANFRTNAGLEPKAPVYGGWESVEPWIEIRCHGHTLGHYLSAVAMMFAATGDAAFKQRVDHIVAELSACQDARGEGVLCAFPDNAAPLENSLAGKEFPGVPWYTTHKVMAGLRDAYVYAGSAQALTSLTRFADWIVKRAREVPVERMQKMLDREHGGMTEILADTYVLTGKKEYLELAERFVHHAVLDPLVAGRDALDGLHSNTQIPKVIGAARLHELTRKAEYARASAFFWHTVVERRSFATGGNADREHFFPPAEFAKHLESAKTMETCCTHNMLRLTRELFQRSPDATLADYYERALYNGILASQDPQSGMMTYFQPTRPGYLKLYHTPTDSFWCCTGSGMENHAKYGDSIYFRDADGLYVNLFIPSELDWKERQLRVTQTTRFPDEESTQLTLHTSTATKLILRIRHPGWCASPAVTINGRRESVSSKPGSYIALNRTWRDGDVVEVRLPMTLRMEPLPNAPEFVAVMHGPLVLAGRLGTEGLTPGADIIVNERTYGDMLNIPMSVPQLRAGAQRLHEQIRRQKGDALSFTAHAREPDRDIELIPYHRIAHERYTLYWKLGGSREA